MCDQITQTTALRTTAPSHLSWIGNLPDAALDILAVRASVPTAGEVMTPPVASHVNRVPTLPMMFGESSASNRIGPVFLTQQKCSRPAGQRLLWILCVLGSVEWTVRLVT